MQYTTKAGDMLDAICWRQYGAGHPYVEAVLAENPGLAQLGPVLPAGVVITLPEFPDQAPAQETVKLWD